MIKHKKLLGRGWDIRFIARPQLKSTLRWWLSAARWGIRGEANITRIGPILIDTLPSRRELMQHLVNAKNACRYWRDRSDEFERLLRFERETRSQVIDLFGAETRYGSR